MNRRSFLGILTGAGAAFVCGVNAPQVVGATVKVPVLSSIAQFAQADADRMAAKIGGLLAQRSPYMDLLEEGSTGRWERL